jgi:hypothetical protein
MKSDPKSVKTCFIGILLSIQELLADALRNITPAQFSSIARRIAVMLQTLYRLIPCEAGFKQFTEIKEVDTRIIILHLVRFNDDFVNYWALELLGVLCRCPYAPRNTKQEFANKHTLLTDGMLTNLVELMSTRIDLPEEDLVQVSAEDAADESAQSAGTSGSNAEGASATAEPSSSEQQPRAEPSAAPAAAAGVQSSGEEVVSSIVSDDVTLFFPNSLVIVAASGLLESIVCSKCDTSSPLLMNKVLDLLMERRCVFGRIYIYIYISI